MSTPSPTNPDNPRERLRQLATEAAAGDAIRREYTEWQDRRSAEVRAVVNAVYTAARCHPEAGEHERFTGEWGSALAAAGCAVRDAGLADHLTSGNPAEMPLSLRYAKELLCLGAEQGDTATIEAVRTITNTETISGIRFYLDHLAMNLEAALWARHEEEALRLFQGRYGPIRPASATAEPPSPTATEKSEGEKPPADAKPALQYVTLDQMAALVNRSKKTLEREMNAKNTDMPKPDVEGGGGKPHEWRWDRIRPWLETKYARQLPKQFPTA